MLHHFSEAEKAAWLKRQPRKVISSKVLIRNQRGDILVLKPNYKPGWSFPGGIVNEFESPLEAALREVAEETGLRLEPQQLCFLGVRYGQSTTGAGDFLHFLFRADIATELEPTIVLDQSENEASKWLNPQEFGTYVEDHVAGLAARAGVNMPVAYTDADDLYVNAPGETK